MMQIYQRTIKMREKFVDTLARLYEYSTTAFSKEKFTQWGDSDDEGYGLTETSPLVSFSMNRWRTVGSIGYPVHNVQVKLISRRPPQRKSAGSSTRTRHRR